MFFQSNIKNVLIILFIMIIFSGVGFYSAYIIQGEKMTEMVREKDSTINRLTSEVSYIRNLFGDIVIEYEELEKDMNDYENNYIQKSVEYKNMSEKYDQLDDSYQSLLQDYSDLNSSIKLEREGFFNKTRVDENKVKILFNEVSFQCSQDSVISVNSLINMDLTDILTGISCNGKTIIALSWRYIEDEPNINATIKVAYGSIEKYVNSVGLNNTLIKDDYKIRYINFTSMVGDEERYVLIATWYVADTSHQYLCVVQKEGNTVVDTFRELTANFT